MGASSNKIKKVFQFQRSATVLILFFATILASFFGGIKLFSYSGKVLYTQVRLIQCYTEIKGLEDTREYNLNMAYTYPAGSKDYVRHAEEADEEIEYWNSLRSGYVHSDDPVIAKAAKNGFEFHIFLISLLPFVASIGLIILILLRKSPILLLIFQVEVLAFDLIMCGLFYLFNFALARFIKFFSHEYNFFYRCWKWDLKNLKRRPI
ncbi:MAG: hypothetical protein HFJ44_05545 [Clostridia bacterium]|jgi:hypothetical protein|nr:hypothetical protein [Clostridia bacterium]